jgi:hypothetical protein
MLRLDQRVRVNKTGQVGFVSKIEGERITVRVPSNTDWPYPSYIHTYEEQVTRVAGSKNDPVADIEEALF